MHASRSRKLAYFAPIVFGAIALTFFSLPVCGQSTPPAMIPVPFINTVAGGGAGSCTGTYDSSSSTLASLDLNDGCPAAEITIPSGYAYGAAIDQWGNVYFGESISSPEVGVVRVIYAGAVTVGGVANPATALIEDANASAAGPASAPVAGDVYTVAGGLTGDIASGTSCVNGKATLSSFGSGCPGTDSYLKKIYSVAVDPQGNVFVVDSSNSNVLELLAASSGNGIALIGLEDSTSTFTNNGGAQVGSIYLIAGHGGGYTDGVLGADGSVHAPYGIAVDAQDNIYIADYENNAVRMINGPSSTSPLAGSYGAGYIHTIGGDCTSSSCTALDGAPASNTAAIGAGFAGPMGIAVDSYGNVYVGDNSDAVSTVPSTVRAIYAGGTNNPLASLINTEDSVISPTAGDVYTLAGSISIDAGSAAVGNGSLATASTVGFDRIQGVAVDGRGNIYIGDYNGAGELAVAELDAANGDLYYLSGGSAPSSLGSGDFCSGGTTGPTMTDSYGDGCPATQSSSHHVEGNLAVDASGNIYYADNDDGLIRELSFPSFAATTVGSADPTQSFAFSLVTGSSSETASNVAVSVVTQGTASTEFVDPGSSAGDTCSGSTSLQGFTNAESTQGDSTCVVPVTFNPLRSGVRPGAIQISATVGGSAMLSTMYLSGIGNAPEIAIDTGTSTQLTTSSTTSSGIAADSAGNAYVDEASSGDLYEMSNSGGSPVLVGAGLSSPHQVAVDGAGNIYVADSGNNRIAEYASGATSTSTTPIATYTSGLGENFSSPEGIAVDGAGNLYIADTGNSRVVEIPANGLPQVLGSGFQTPVAVAVDGSGNVYVADSTLNEIAEIAPSTGTQSTIALASGATPVAVAVDAAGNVYYADSGTQTVVEVPASGSGAVTVIPGLNKPTGVALDPSGNLYVADTQSGAFWYNRSLSSASFSVIGSTLSATLTNIGNESYAETETSGSYFTQTDSTDFDITPSSLNGCSFPALVSGAECGMSASSTASGTATDDVVFSGNAVNAASVGWDLSTASTLTTLPAPVIAVTSAQSSVATGQSLTVTVSVTGSGTAPTGTVYLQSGAYTSSQETIGTSPCTSNTSCSFTIPADSLTQGSDTITAYYSGDSNYTAGTGTVIVTVTQSSYALSASTPAVVAPGGTATSTITGESSTTGYTGAVNLTSCVMTASSATGAIDVPTCTIVASTIAYMNGVPSGTASVMVQTTPPPVSMLRPIFGGHGKWEGPGGAMLAFLIFLGVPARRRKWSAMLGMVLLLVAMGSLTACGGSAGKSSTSAASGGTTAGTYTFQVTGTGNDPAATQATATFTVTVN